jgi:pyruvate/2-oxoglutarate dehydrogenase complex dihydrolipoamide acyltransferase (E2) component
MTRAVVCLPELGHGFGAATVVDWAATVGDEIEFGVVICRVRMRDRLFLDRQVVSSGPVRKFLHRLNGRREARLIEQRDGPVAIVRAAEPGVLSRIVTDAGDQAQVGDPLAVMAVGDDRREPDATGDDDLAELLHFRVSLDLEVDDEPDALDENHRS